MRLTLWLLGVEVFAVDLSGAAETEATDESPRVDDLGSVQQGVGFAPMVTFTPSHTERGYEDD